MCYLTTVNKLCLTNYKRQKMTTKIEIYRSLNIARRAAKLDYSDIFGVKPESVRIEIYDGHYAPTSCRCVCGETACYELQPRMNKKQRKLWDSYQEGRGLNRFFWYGVCHACGKSN